LIITTYDRFYRTDCNPDRCTFLFGPQKIPELARSLGSALGEFKKAQRATELELNQFDAFTRKPAENKFTPKDKEEDKEKLETSPLEKEENKEKTEHKTSLDKTK
jgi:sec-independent protein translocase protein TatA